jgi:IS30 family transposase
VAVGVVALRTRRSGPYWCKQPPTGVPVYFCDPHSPWQRGSNENTNGLLRQYYPRRTDFRGLTQSDFDNVAAELNGRPRQTLGWKSPCQALDEALR